MSKKKTEKTESKFIPDADINLIEQIDKPVEEPTLIENGEETEKLALVSQKAYDELVKLVHEFIEHTEGRLYTIREYLKTVKHDGRKLLGDEDLDEAFGKGFWSE